MSKGIGYLRGFWEYGYFNKNLNTTL